MLTVYGGFTGTVPVTIVKRDAHSDQERILETKFQHYARFYYDIVKDVAGPR